MPAGKKKDWVTPVAVTVGAVGVGAGLYLFMKKPKGADPGDLLMAKYTFTYLGSGGDYVLQVSLGRILVGNWFDHVEGLTWTSEIYLPAGPREWEFLVECPLPEAVEPGVYDGEAVIRTPEMDWLDYIEGTKVLSHGAITVRKE